MCSNEPPCLTQNEPPCLVHVRVHACMHAHTHESFFFRPSKKTIANKSVFKRAPVSHAERAPVSRARTCACMHACTNFFYFYFTSKKNKITSHKSGVFQTSPRVITQNELPCLVHGARTCACTHARIYYYFFISSCLPHKCAQTSPQVLMGLCARSNEPPSFDGPLCSLKRAPKFWRRCCCLCRPQWAQTSPHVPCMAVNK